MWFGCYLGPKRDEKELDVLRDTMLLFSCQASLMHYGLVSGLPGSGSYLER
jgi:hypothetical protein